MSAPNISSRLPAGSLLMAMLLFSSLRLCAQTNYPSWWANYGVLSGTSVQDYGAANQGEAKNIAVAAVSELDSDLAQFGGAGATLDALSLSLTATSASTSNYSVLNLGELKSLAQPFYDRLMTLGYFGSPITITGTAPVTTGTYPWTGGSARDYAIANIGQVKYAFSFDVTYSSSGSSIPDWWVDKYFPGGIGYTGTSGYVVWSGSQVTFQTAYQSGWNPLDYYNGQMPVLSIVGGNGQTGPSGGLAPEALAVSVTDGSGNPLVGAPVVLTVGSSGGEIEESDAGPLGAAVTILTDELGLARGFFQFPDTSGTNNYTITASAGVGSSFNQQTFTETSDGGSGGTYASPFAPSDVVGVINADGSEEMTWKNNSDSTASIPIWYWDPGSSAWVHYDDVPAGTTHYHFPITPLKN
jgi:hypothetical protein